MKSLYSGDIEVFVWKLADSEFYILKSVLGNFNICLRVNETVLWLMYLLSRYLYVSDI